MIWITKVVLNKTINAWDSLVLTSTASSIEMPMDLQLPSIQTGWACTLLLDPINNQVHVQVECPLYPISYGPIYN